MDLVFGKRRKKDKSPGRCVCCGKLVTHWYQVAEVYRPLSPRDVCMCRTCIKERRPSNVERVCQELQLTPDVVDAGPSQRELDFSQ